MRFFRPRSGPPSSRPASPKMTGAAIRPEAEERLKALKDKRVDRREKIMDQAADKAFEKNAFVRDLEARKSPDAPRSSFYRQERKESYRSGKWYGKKPSEADEPPDS